jgi:F-type H+-transporting ATPase subunit epsilon
MASATSHSLECIIVTPERAVLDERTDFVALPLFDGELGVLPGRAPLIGRLGYGELRIGQGQSARLFYVDGGFVQVRNNVVTVLTSQAQRAEDIKPDVVTQTLQAQPPPTATPQSGEARLKEQERARAQLRVARHASGERRA